MRTRYVIGLLAGLALAGCANGLRSSSESAQETLITSSATVQAVDQSTRRVTLQDDADGNTFTVTAGPEVRNLAQVNPGDHVQIDFYRSVAASMADPSDTGEKQTAVLTARPEEGAKPGGLAAKSTSLVVQFISYDSNTALATFRTPDGLTRRAVVPPELRGFAESRAPGARVLVTMTEAVAVTITETSS